MALQAIADKNANVTTLRPSKEAKERVQKVLDAKAWAKQADEELEAKQAVAQDMGFRIAKVMMQAGRALLIAHLLLLLPQQRTTTFITATTTITTTLLLLLIIISTSRFFSFFFFLFLFLSLFFFLFFFVIVIISIIIIIVVIVIFFFPNSRSPVFMSAGSGAGRDNGRGAE